MACGRAGRACSGNSRLLICPAICCLPLSPTGSQADELGDLDPATARLLKQIGTGGGTLKASRLTNEFGRRRAELKAGTILVREWRGATHHVTVVDDGFVWNGKTYRSLSSIARAITGTKWNGPRFFGMREAKSKTPEERRGS